MKCEHPYCDEEAFIGEIYCIDHLEFITIPVKGEHITDVVIIEEIPKPAKNVEENKQSE